MANKPAQIIEQTQTQQQTLTPQQVLVARLTELPVEGLRDRIQKELQDNQWLEAKQGGVKDKDAQRTDDKSKESTSEDSYDDSDFVVPRVGSSSGSERHDNYFGGSKETFNEHFIEQLSGYNLSEREREIARYLIGSLESDGMLRTPLSQISDEMDIYHDVQVSVDELERLLTSVIQQMEPTGVGARNLRECLVIQAERSYKGADRDQLLRLFSGCWDDFIHKRWGKIQAAMRLDDFELQQMLRRVRHLTPRPGGSIGDDEDGSGKAITPDFIVTTDKDGKLRMMLNEGDLPILTLSPDAEVSLSMPVVTKEDREAVRYLREHIVSAKFFIEAIAQRRKSMILTMQAIIKLQRAFFMTGDETRLRPMNLEDVSRLTGLDISTVSRVSNSKYVKTPFGTYPLRWFFSTATKKDGDEVSVRSILSALRDLVDNEDKNHPMSDEKLVTLLREKGYAVARRTIAKYRTQLGIPESRLR